VNLQFGDTSAYYASSWPGDSGEDEMRATRQTQRLKDILVGYNAGARARVERAHKQWNGVVREYLRAETALRLTVGDDQQTVPVRIVDELPEPLVLLLEQIPDHVLWLSLNRAVLSQTIRGLELVLGAFAAHENETLMPDPPATEQDVVATRALIQSMLNNIDHAAIAQNVAGLPRDVLGAYFFHIPEIRLYWIAIALLAGMLGVAVEALTVVVLTHELAHAYTHLGRDIDGERWSSTTFGDADLEIAEGLAQFYTVAVCARMTWRLPSAQQAFDALLEKQAEPYRVHRDWTKSESRAGEVVRGAMIATRLKGITRYADFQIELKEVSGRIGRTREKTAGSRPSADGV
jgi:hypothetical protein